MFNKPKFSDVASAAVRDALEEFSYEYQQNDHKPTDADCQRAERMIVNTCGTHFKAKAHVTAFGRAVYFRVVSKGRKEYSSSAKLAKLGEKAGPPPLLSEVGS